MRQVQGNQGNGVQAQLWACQSYPRKSLHCCLHLLTILLLLLFPFPQVSAAVRPGVRVLLSFFVQRLTFWVFLSNSSRFKYLQDYLCLIMFDQPSNEFNHKYCNPLICYIRSYQSPFDRSGQGRSSLRSGDWMWGFKLCPLALVPSQWPDKAFFIVTWLHAVPPFVSFSVSFGSLRSVGLKQANSYSCMLHVQKV